MNENKCKLILFIAQTFSDQMCAKILEDFVERISNRNSIFLANSENWEESKHPREQDGRFAPGGSGRSLMTKKEAQKWDAIGKTTEFHGRKTDGTKEIVRLKGEIKKLTRMIKKSHPKEITDNLKGKLVKAQRDLAEWTRIEKSRRRLDLENGVTKRVLMKKVKQFRELEDDIDFIEEKLADRDPSSETYGELVFPQTKDGKKAKETYDRLLQQKQNLDAEIDWEKVGEYEDEEEQRSLGFKKPYDDRFLPDVYDEIEAERENKE